MTLRPLRPLAKFVSNAETGEPEVSSIGVFVDEGPGDGSDEVEKASEECTEGESKGDDDYAYRYGDLRCMS